MLKKITLSALFICACIGTERLYYYQHGGFRLSKVISQLNEEYPSHHSSPTLEIRSLLQQPFRFIGSGGTCFAFLGKDEKTILKLFKHQYFSNNRHKHKSLPFFFGSCALADEKLKEQTALIYLCLQKNPAIDQVVTLTDRWGFSHSLNLKDTEFAVQQNAELLFPYFERNLRAGRIEQCKTAIDSLLSLILKRCTLGIADRDPNLLINFGFVDDKAAEIDIGSFFYHPELLSPFKQIQELFSCTYALQKWLEKQSPELLHYIQEQITQKHNAHRKTPA